MVAHAIIVGVDRYKNDKWNLGTAVADALKFHTWATTIGGVDPANVTLLLAPIAGREPAGVAYTLADFQALQDAVDAVAAQPVAPGDRLYVYVASHGISAPNVVGNKGNTCPVLVPTDVSDISRNRHLLYQLDTMIDSLASHGPAEQFFFIDACRNFVIDSMVAPSASGAWRPRDGDAACRQYALYATSAGDKAYGEFGGGVFSDELIAALEARGPKLGNADNGSDYQLEWSEVTTYVIEAVRGRIKNAQKAGLVQEPQPYSRVGARGVLRELSANAIATRKLSISVTPAAARDKCSVAIGRRVPGATLPLPSTPIAPKLAMPIECTNLLPGVYAVTASGPDFEEPSPKVVTLWGAEERIDLDMQPVGRGFQLQGPGTLEIETGARSDLTVMVRNAFDEVVATGRGYMRASLPSGTYKIQVMSVGVAPTEATVEVEAQETTTWRYVAPPLDVSPPVAKMLGAHGLNPNRDNYVEPSELIGTIADQTLASLLGLAAFAQVFHDPGNLQKLQSFGVVIPPVLPGRSAILVLVAANDHPDQLGAAAVGVARADGVTALALQPLNQFEAARQTHVDIEPGVHTVRIATGSAVASFAVTALRDRVSILVVVLGDRLDVQQYILPSPTAPSMFPIHVQIEKFLRAERAQRRFAANQTEALTPSELDDLLFGKWVDPLFGAIGGYTLLRRGEIAKWRDVANGNMLANFAELPDTHVLAGLVDFVHRGAHYNDAMARGIPPIADGVRALAGWHAEQKLPMPPALAEVHRYLVPGAAWTAWISPRPRIPFTATELGPVPPGWEDLADAEAILLRSIAAIAHVQGVSQSGIAMDPVAPNQRVAMISFSDRVVAPGVVLGINGSAIEHDCASVTDGVLVSIATGTVLGVQLPGGRTMRPT